MKLYIYDHCPFCIRAKMIFGLKNLPFEEFVLLNDDEATPIGLVGKKMVPILMKDDGTAMGESLDIVKYVDSHYGEQIVSLDVRPEIEAWLKQISSYAFRLLHPRVIHLDVAEYATQEAIDYFVKKKTESIGDFAENLANSAEYIAQLEQDLAQLSSLVLADDKANGKQLSIEDIMLFPMLRNLTCVKGLRYPANIQAYVEKMSELSNVGLYTSQAV
ncbi:glutaredoxin, GrxB family [Pasteurellaceae bacterium 15-036681]|nr:glutaredoxin, GrxB family [Pasteurellaceae bacterium 15-036681]